MKITIVDDDRLAREELKEMLNKRADIDIIAECACAVEAEKSILENKPDLLFMDIQMPGESGLELIKRMDHPPRTVFISAYDEFAIEAFKIHAYDYLLKPIVPERLTEVFDRIHEENSIPSAVESAEKLFQDDSVFIKDGDKVWFTKIDDIRYFQSEGNYAKVYFKDHKPLILRSLNSLEQRLDDRLFFRANRKYLININHIADLETWFNGSLQLEMSCGKKIEVSRRQSIRFKDTYSI